MLLIVLQFSISSEKTNGERKKSGIKNNNSLVFEDSSPGLRSSLDANLPTIYIPSNIPISIEKGIDFHGAVDSLGDECYKTNVFKGPKLDSQYVDFSYLEKFLSSISNAKY